VFGRIRSIKWSLLIATLGVYYLLPWIRWDRGPGMPDQAVLADLAGGRFYFFGIEIWPQEVYYITGLLILAAVGLFLVTALFGRVWCGYVCPQTVWTDLFLVVERFFEGDRNARMKLDRSPLSLNKAVRKTGKHAVWILVSFATGGAFIRWWFYGGAPDHALYSRYHLYGIKDGDKQYKVQVLNYYGVRDGAPVSALFKVRWAEVTATGVGPTQELADLDGTAGGPQGKPTDKSECLDLGTKARSLLTPAEARVSSAWHICFRRQDISVNGEVGGPRNVGAVNLDAAKIATDTLPDIVARTDESELARFDAVNAASLAGQIFRGDRVVSAFGTLWLERGASPPAPAKQAWLVYGADSTSKYMLGFARFEGADATKPGTIVMRVKSAK